MALIKSIATVGGFTMISRVLGFVRDILIASVLGAGFVADAFFVAFKFPNLFRRLFAEGAFSAAFVPLYVGALETETRDAARAFGGQAHAFAEQAMSVLLWTLFVFVIAIEIAMPWAMRGFAPGFVGDVEKFNLAVDLTRITFPYLLFISLVSLMAGVLNSLGRFAAAAATPILLNLFLIGAVLLATPYTPTVGHALAGGVAAAGVAQFIWLYIHCGRGGVWLRMRPPRLTPAIRTLLRRLVPVAIGAGVYQVNLLIDTIVASFLPSGSISFLFYADRVTQLPLGVVGVAVGTALLPVLSRQIRAGDGLAASNSQNRAIEFSLLLTLPAAAALFVIAGPIIHVLFERGAFGAVEASATAAALSVYALGLPAYVLIKTLAPAYFAREDTSTPVKIAVAAMAVNLILNLILMGPYLHVGIAMATVVSSYLNAGLLAIILYRRGHMVLDRRLIMRVPRIVAGTVIMAVALILVATEMGDALAGPLLSRIGALVLLVAGGGLVYGLALLIMRTVTLAEIRNMVRRKPDSV